MNVRRAAMRGVCVIKRRLFSLPERKDGKVLKPKYPLSKFHIAYSSVMEEHKTCISFNQVVRFKELSYCFRIRPGKDQSFWFVDFARGHCAVVAQVGWELVALICSRLINFFIKN